MTFKVNIHDAKTHLSKLIDRVMGGEEIIIAKAGKPVARLLPIHDRPAERFPGTAVGKITISDDFNEPLPDAVLLDFES
jgi:prevent-host-death family protein